MGDSKDARVDNGAILDSINRLLPSQFEILLTKLDTPIEYLSGAQTPISVRGAELVRWAKQAGRLGDLERLVSELLRSAPCAPPAQTIDHTSMPGFGRVVTVARVWASKIHDVALRREFDLLLARIQELIGQQELFGRTNERQAQIAEIAYHLDVRFSSIFGKSLLAECSR